MGSRGWLGRRRHARLAARLAAMADTAGIELGGRDLASIDLSARDLRGALPARGAELGGARLREAELDFAEAEGLSLQGADLRNTRGWPAPRLEGAVLTGALADADTTWPAGFDPRAAGVEPLGEAEAAGA